MSFASIDYRKLIDFIPRSWIMKAFNLYKISPAIIKFLKLNMLKWQTTLHLSHKAWNLKSNSVDIKCNIFQVDYLSSLLLMDKRLEMKVSIIFFTWTVRNFLPKIMITGKDCCQQKRFILEVIILEWTWQVYKSNIWKRKINKIKIDKFREKHLKSSSKKKIINMLVSMKATKYNMPPWRKRFGKNVT